MPLHVATWIEAQTRAVAVPSVKQRLAALRHLFDWLVIGHVMQTNPAASVRGPQHIVKGGKTPVLDPAETRDLIDSIDTTTPGGCATAPSSASWSIRSRASARRSA